ncbi:MAG: chromate transporter [Bacillaceae bacterium]
MFQLFLTFLKIGAFTFGGGYAMVPIIENELVKKKKLLSSEEFIDYLSIAQSYPGVLAVNISVLLGYRLYGVIGAAVCVLASILPAFGIVIILSYFYFQNRTSNILDAFFFGVGPVVIALLLYTFVTMVSKMPKSVLNILLVVISFVAVGVFGISPLYLLIGGGIISIWVK